LKIELFYNCTSIQTGCVIVARNGSLGFCFRIEKKSQIDMPCCWWIRPKKQSLNKSGDQPAVVDNGSQESSNFLGQATVYVNQPLN